MKFKERLLQGILIKRYKRFFVDIKYQNKTITAHCPNSGSMMGLLKPGNKLWFSHSDNPKRKLKYTLQMIGMNNSKVGINTQLTNKIILESLEKKRIKELTRFTNIKAEVKFSDKTRFDFLISNKKEKCFLEVKNVTLVRQNNVAEFPDAITSRGTKHLKELINAKKKGYESYILYLIQRENCKSFKIANDIDEEYKIAFIEALKNNVKVLCYDCKLSNEEIVLNSEINYEK
jgi:sugar fermentation stimulation protein A